ncbi:nucleotidyltransferase domain-containing protein [Candidatus Micrarchaeota archaeon]|nr:nucleotidyltransferase domain-containing protein [Candidatus Micrarchaeota archaeon]
MDALELVKYSGAKNVLRTLFGYPKRQFTINELAKTSKTPFTSVWRLVRKLEPAGVIETNRLGNSIIVRLKNSEYTQTFARLLELNTSPQAFTVQKLKEELRKNKGIKGVFLFGSVARGEEKLESDIDLAILATKGFDANKLVFDVYEKHGTKVVPLVFHDKKEAERFLKNKENVKLL